MPPRRTDQFALPVVKRRVIVFHVRPGRVIDVFDPADVRVGISLSVVVACFDPVDDIRESGYGLCPAALLSMVAG